MIKFNVKLSDSTYGVVRELAEEMDGTMADVVREALSVFWWLAKEYREGNRLMVRRYDQVTELMIPSLERLNAARPGERGRRLAQLETWRVCVSHTSDLRHRPDARSFVDAAEAAVRLAGHSLGEMDLLPASDVAPGLSSTRMVEQSDVYVGIIGHLFGSVVPDRPAQSYTQLEFETATRVGLPRLVFLVDDQVHARDADKQSSEHEERQQQFRRRLKRDAGVTVAHVATPEELEIGLYHALTKLKDEVRSELQGRRGSR